MNFPARREPWLIPILILDGAITLAAAIWFATEAVRRDDPIFWLAAAMLVLGVPFLAWILLGIRYEVTGSELVTHIGPFRTRVPLREIDEVFPTKGNPISPAWAQDRLQLLIRSGDRVQTGVVNPVDRTGFLEHLAAADPGFVRIGDKLQRRHS
jgi:hypothetical protein